MTSTLLGVVLLTRHGDRQGFYQSDTSYTASDTVITPLGSVQHYQSGQTLQKRYASNDSAPTDIADLAWPVPNLVQIDAKADSSEGQVILDSAYAFWQGMFPASSQANTTLANGTTITAPLGGYTYIPVESVEPEDSIVFEGYTSCPTFTERTAAVYASDDFEAKASEEAAFLDSLAPVVSGRNTSFANMWNVFDYMNVNYIHNASFYDAVDIETMRHARALANYHENAVFSEDAPGGLGNLAGQVMLPAIIDGLERIANETTDVKIVYLGASYKPFLSIFSMINLTDTSIAGNIVDYASVAAWEVWKDASDTVSIEMRFRNGTTTTDDGSDLAAMQLWGQDSVSLDTFKANFEPYVISDLGEWCNLCENTASRGCDLIELVNATTEYSSVTSTSGRHRTSPVVSGVIGALVGFVLAAIAFALLEAYRSRRGGGRRMAGARGLKGDASDSAYELNGATSGAPSIDQKSERHA